MGTIVVIFILSLLLAFIAYTCCIKNLFDLVGYSKIKSEEETKEIFKEKILTESKVVPKSNLPLERLIEKIIEVVEKANEDQKNEDLANDSRSKPINGSGQSEEK
jgi:hypothetical protein